MGRWTNKEDRELMRLSETMTGEETDGKLRRMAAQLFSATGVRRTPHAIKMRLWRLRGGQEAARPEKSQPSLLGHKPTSKGPRWRWTPEESDAMIHAYREAHAKGFTDASAWDYVALALQRKGFRPRRPEQYASEATRRRRLGVEIPYLARSVKRSADSPAAQKAAEEPTPQDAPTPDYTMAEPLDPAGPDVEPDGCDTESEVTSTIHIPDTDDDYHWALLQRLQRAAHARGWKILVIPSDYNVPAAPAGVHPALFLAADAVRVLADGAKMLASVSEYKRGPSILDDPETEPEDQ